MGNQAFFPETKLKWIKSLDIFGRTWWLARASLATGFQHSTDSILRQARDKASLPLTMSLSKTVWCCNKIFSSVKNPASVLELSANWYRDSSGSSSVNLNAIDSRLKAQVSSCGNSKGKIQIIQQAEDFSNGQTKKLKKKSFLFAWFFCVVVVLFLLSARWPHGWCSRLRSGRSGFEPYPGSLLCS